MTLFWSIIDFLKGTAPFFIMFDIIVAIVLLILGLMLLSKKNRALKTKKIAGMVCLSIALLTFLGALSNALFSFFVF
ncbi:hypothetical protein AMS59_20715 [Lysinibacillus sp. FJAT-14745]|uniref:hypothetical protein n=1 Tax=Lysinibacillus sp. FJAT-14745 TaxID=1704289 RepID=UPI0006AB8353|nr:hypothetical protein [Lysinibacillus sp. FJAT-14745]KOP70249.1 hypothetical protein AMS59_20715 [Lysinibacillus sp. FJAT-14745]